MKLKFKLLASLTSASTLALVTGCWTSDAHDVPTDAGPIGASEQCGALAATQCFQTEVIPATGEFLDFSVWDPNATPPFPPDPAQPPQGACKTTFSVTFGDSSTGTWVHSGPDYPMGNTWGFSFHPINPKDPNAPVDPNDPNNICHLKGNIPSAGSWGIYMNPTTKCDDGSLRGGLVDASAFDGISITIGGNAGPPGYMKINFFSLGTPEDPYREQKLTVKIVMPPVPTTYKFLWNQMTATCGRLEWFNPAAIINVQGEMLALAGLSYTFDVEIGKISFYKAN